MNNYRKIDVGRNKENDFGVNSRYYEGELIGKKTTPLGHMLLTFKNVKSIRHVHGIVQKKNLDHDEMNFLVPKRRQRVFEFCEMTKFNEILRIMLLPESRSGKWTVAEAEVII